MNEKPMALFPCPTTGGEHDYREGGARDRERYSCARCQTCLQTRFAITAERDQRHRADRAEALLRLYASGNDCVVCHSSPRLVSETYPLSPGSRCTVVVPKYWTVDHEDGCEVGRITTSASSASPKDGT